MDERIRLLKISKRMKTFKGFTRNEWIVIGSVLLLAAFAICVGLGYISVGQAGIAFNF